MDSLEDLEETFCSLYYRHRITKGRDLNPLPYGREKGEKAQVQERREIPAVD